MSDSKRFWKEFTRKVGNRLSDITIEEIYAYRDYVLNKKKNGKIGPAAVNNRFSCIKTVFRHASVHIRDMSQLPDIKTVQSYLERLQPLKKKKKSKPTPISAANFRKVLERENNPVYKETVVALQSRYNLSS